MTAERSRLDEAREGRALWKKWGLRERAAERRRGGTRSPSLESITLCTDQRTRAR